MSVLKSKRQESKLQVLVKARELATYTTQIIGNEKSFPKRSRWIIAQKIADEAVEIYTCCRRANSVSVEMDSDYVFRHDQQTKAFSHCEALLSLIEIAYGLYNIESRRIEHWTGLVIETEKLLGKWKLNDKRRYGCGSAEN